MAPERSCTAKNAAGEPCGAPSNVVDPRTGLCPAHDPDKREKVRDAARKGGQAKARKDRATGVDTSGRWKLDSYDAAERWLDLILRAVLSGRITHSQARSAVRAVEAWMKAREQGEEAERLEELEEKVAALKRGDLEVVK